MLELIKRHGKLGGILLMLLLLGLLACALGPIGGSHHLLSQVILGDILSSLFELLVTHPLIAFVHSILLAVKVNLVFVNYELW